MSNTRQTAKDIHISDNAGSSKDKKGRIYPFARLIVAFVYILLVVSFPVHNFYGLMGLAGMFLYLLASIIWYQISIKALLRRIWPVFLLTVLAGSAGLVMDREIYFSYGSIIITYGMLSMLVLVIKGVFCVTASYILSVTASIMQICHALYLMHVPGEIVMVVMLMHRYLMVLIKEAERMQQAYRLRAPGQKGLHFKAWGSFIGLLLLRSMDRSEEVYESMKLRGFCGVIKNFSFKGSKKASIAYVVLWVAVLAILRVFPVFFIVGAIL